MMYKVPVMDAFILKNTPSGNFIKKQCDSDENKLKDWLNNSAATDFKSRMLYELKEPMHVAWYMLNFNKCPSLMDAFYRQEVVGGKHSENTTFELLNLRVLDIYMPILLLNHEDWRLKLECMSETVLSMDDAIEYLARRTKDEPDLSLRYWMASEAILLLRSVTQKSTSYLFNAATSESNETFVEYLQKEMPRLESGFKRRNHLVILLSTLIASALSMRQAYKGINDQVAFDYLFNNMKNVLNADEQQPEWAENHLKAAIDKYRCIHEQLLGMPVKNPGLLFGIPCDAVEQPDIMTYQYGFVTEKSQTNAIERAFDVNAFKVGELFQPGLRDNYISSYAYRTESTHWTYALEKLEAPQRKDNLVKITHLMNHEESPELAKDVCKKLFESTNFGTSKFAIALYQRCIQSFPELRDDLYLIAGRYPRNNASLLPCLKELGAPSDAIVGQLTPELRKLKLEADMGLDL